MSQSLDYEVDLCHQSHGARATGREIDGNGDHAHSLCPSAANAMGRTHRLLLTALKDLAHKAGVCTVAVEPKTKTLLDDQFTEKQCAEIAPENLRLIESSELQGAIEELKTCTSAVQTEAIAERVLNVLKSLPGARKGLRIDAELVRSNGDVLWVDVAQVHPSCATYRSDALNYVKAVLSWEREGRLIGQPAPPNQSRAVRDIERNKNSKYLPLLAIAETQVARGRRAVRPVFRGAVLSHSLEPSKQLISTFEWLTTAFIETHEPRPPRDDGISLAQAVADFRKEFRWRFALGCGSGFGGTCLAAGYPHSSA